MYKYMINMTARTLLHSWVNEGLVSRSESGSIENFILLQQKDELPLYLRILSVIGLFIISIFFAGVFFVLGLITEEVMIFLGIIFVVSAICIKKISISEGASTKNNSPIPITSCIIGIGKILFVIGFTFELEKFGLNNSLGFTAATLLITVATYHAYPMSADRFLSILTIFTSLLMNIIDKSFGSYAEIALNLFFFIQIILVAMFFTSSIIKRDYIPFAYATIFSLCNIVIYFATHSIIGSVANNQSYSMVFINSLLILFLIGLIGFVAGGVKKLKTEPLLITSLGVMLLGVISAPGVILSICIMVLGYAKHDRLLLLISTILMPVVIFYYYYNLDLNLMVKSAVLLGSGVVLLIGYCYTVYKKFDLKK